MAAHQTIENALREADEAWNYQLHCIFDYTSGLESKKKLSPEEIVAAAAKLAEMENRASAAFQLTLAAQQINMRLDNDYTAQRIANDRQLTGKKVDEFSVARGGANRALSAKISKVGGKPLALADYVQDGYQAPNPALGVLHEAKKNAGRLNPVRMHGKAKQDISAKRARLQDEISTENALNAVAKKSEEELDALSFAFNEADTVVFDGENLRLFKTSDPAHAQSEESDQ